jgi:hypothetical protein
MGLVEGGELVQQPVQVQVDDEMQQLQSSEDSC